MERDVARSKRSQEAGEPSHEEDARKESFAESMDALKDSQKEEPSAMHPRFVVRVAVPLFNATSPDPAAPAASDRESW